MAALWEEKEKLGSQVTLPGLTKDCHGTLLPHYADDQ